VGDGGCSLPFSEFVVEDLGVYDSIYPSTQFELAINRVRRLFAAFATAAAIGAVVGSPGALADPEPLPPPEPVPAPAPANIPEFPGLIAPGPAPTHVSEIPRADG
jgi:hypothetical protein